MEYEDAGDFDSSKKFKRSVRINLKWYLMFLTATSPIMLVLYLSHSIDNISFKDLAVAFSNLFGTIILVLCLGYSLICFPQSILEQQDIQGELGKCQYEVSYCNYISSQLVELLEKEVQVLILGQRENAEQKLFDQCFPVILRSIPRDVYHVSQQEIQTIKMDNFQSDMKVYTEEELVEIHKRIVHYVADIIRLRTKEFILRKKAFLLEDILESKFTMGRQFSKQFINEEIGVSVFEELRLKYHLRVKPLITSCLGFLAIVLSSLVFLGEVLGLCNQRFQNKLREFFQDYQNIGVQLIWVSALIYIVVSVHFAIFRFKIAGFYNLNAYFQTDPSSLLYSGINFSRVSSALCLNFLSILNISDSSFNEVMGKENFTLVFGKNSRFFIPLALVLCVVINMTNAYSKTLNKLGLSKWEFGNHTQENLQSEGKKILVKGKKNSPLIQARILESTKLDNLERRFKGMFSSQQALNIMQTKPNSQSAPKKNKFFV